jgi:hypothetical protein
MPQLEKLGVGNFRGTLQPRRGLPLFISLLSSQRKASVTPRDPLQILNVHIVESEVAFYHDNDIADPCSTFTKKVYSLQFLPSSS